MWRAIARVLIRMPLSIFSSIKNCHESRSDTFLSWIHFHNELIALFRNNMRAFARGHRIALKPRGKDRSYGPTHKFGGERNAGAT